jgi:hypothetical protein
MHLDGRECQYQFQKKSRHEGVKIIPDMDENSELSSSSTVMAVVCRSHFCYTGSHTAILEKTGNVHLT